jgi:hypothetical protein
MALISVTRLRLRSVRFLPQFVWWGFRSGVQAKRARGNVTATGLQDSHLTFWTLTAWTDENSMRAFMLSGAHKRAMPKLVEWCDEASVVHWHQESADLPSWTEAHQRMVEEGRLSRVRYPSDSQVAKRITPPRVSSTRS